MVRYAMVTDLRKCVACEACTVACNAEWGVPPGQARTKVQRTPIQGQFPNLVATAYIAQCNHCDRPSCVEVCPVEATFKDANGIVQIKAEVCIACGACVEACPYEARFINSGTEKADKCSFCAPRLEQGEQPACVLTCPAHAKFFGDLEDPKSEVYRKVRLEKARRVETSQITIGPNVYYLGRKEHIELIASLFPPRQK